MAFLPPSVWDDLLLRVELDDQLLLDRELDVLALRQLDDRPGEGLRRKIEPGRDSARPRGFDRGLDLLVGAALLLDGHDLALADAVGRDRDLPAVDRHVAVPHELPRLRARGREAQGVDHVVQATLELLEQVRPGDPLAPLRLGEGQPELALQQPVDPLDLLLLAKLDAVTQELAAPAAVLARRIVAALDGALVLEAAIPFQEQLHPFSPAEPANRLGVSSHSDFSPGPSFVYVLPPGQDP